MGGSLCLLAGLLLAGAPAWGAGAADTLRSAEAQLDRGEFAEALVSADSAFAADPTMRRALLVKGLAYEALGRLELAASWLEAAAAQTSTPDAEILAAAERVRSARLDAVKERRARQPGAAEPVSPEVPGFTERIATLRSSSEAIAQFVEAAVSEGSCALALAGALELTESSSEAPRGFRLLGDAQRCSDQKRSALLSYQRYRDLGGDDAGVFVLIDGLSSSLATLRVAVQRQSESSVPRVWITFADEEQVGRFEGQDRFVFDHLPTAVPITLRLIGKGFVPLSRDLNILTPGERRELTVAPEFIGLTDVAVVDYEPERYNVALLSPEGRSPAPPGSSVRVTAAEVSAEVTSEYGTVLVPLELEPEGRLVFDPRPWLPSELTVVGIPVGAKLRIFVEGGDDAIVEREITVPLFPGQTDAESGVRLAPPQKVSSLIGGSAGLFVNHPVLGKGNGSFVLAPGGVNATTFDWGAMSGVPAVRSRWDDWQARRRALERSSAHLPRVTLGIGIGTGIAAGILWAATAAERANYDNLKDAALRMGTLRPAEWAELDDDRRASADRERGFLTGAIVNSALSTVGIVVSIPLGAGHRKRVADLGAWSMAPPSPSVSEPKAP